MRSSQRLRRLLRWHSFTLEILVPAASSISLLNYVQGFVEPAQIHFLKFDGKVSDQRGVNIFFALYGIGVGTLSQLFAAVTLKCSTRGNIQGIGAIFPQAAFVPGDAGTKIPGYVSRRSKATE